MNKKLIFEVAGIAIATITTCVAVVVKAKKDTADIRDDINQKLGILDKIADSAVEASGPVDIPEEIINAAIDRHVNRIVNGKARVAVDRISAELEEDIKTKISKEVNAQYDDIRGLVKEEARAKIGKIDVYDIKKVLMSEFKAEMRSSFTNQLNSILNDAQRRVDEYVNDFENKADEAMDEAESGIEEKVKLMVDKYASNLAAAADTYSAMTKRLQQ